MNKKIIGVLICMLFIGTILIPGISGTIDTHKNVDHEEVVDVASLPPNDELDQYQILMDGCGHVQYDLWWAQSFTPTVETLTRIELHCFMWVDSQSTNFICSIRDDLYGEDIVSLVKRDGMPTISPGWYEFDFPDISVNPSQKYYIVCRTDGDNDPTQYDWSWNPLSDVYKRGEIYYSWPFDEGWEKYPLCYDFAFRTYGYGGGSEDESDIVINKITGGFGLKASILNNGTASAYNVTLSIDVEPASPFSIVKSDNHTEKLIPELGVNKTTEIKSSNLRGIGPITITVQAAEASKKATAFLLGPLVLRVTEL